jgi:hypothetical protein
MYTLQQLTEIVSTLLENLAAEVLDFACFLQVKRQQELGKASETKAEGGDELSYQQAKARTLAMMATGFVWAGRILQTGTRCMSGSVFVGSEVRGDLRKH